MSATEYTADLRDIHFVLHEQLKVTEVLAGKVEDFDRDLCESMVDEAYKIATDVLWPMNVKGDRQGCHYKAGTVTTPDGYKEAWELYKEGGWLGLDAPAEFGGMAMPHALAIAIAEMHTAACMGFALYPGLTRSAGNLLARDAPAHLRDVVCNKLFAGDWTGTMCLTEAGAGSDVGANRATAKPTDESGVYLLEGEKVFISSGEHDLTENIIHLVLARTPGAPKGTKGLSIFLVPKFHFDAEGNLGERNDIFCESIEEKLGIHGSSTCTLVMGAKGPCKGWLLGKEFDGIKIMFGMMNEARLEVGLQGLAGATAAYQLALGFAKERVQGAPLHKMMDDNAEAVAIIHHPDVRRMLLWQKVHAETMRSLVYETALQIDMLHYETDPTKLRDLKGRVELMTPIVKAYCSDKGFDVTVTALQTFGGYGYTGEYPIEQVMRDTKISSIYEGTNGIQAMDLLGRKMQKAGGALFMAWMNDANKDVEAAKAHEVLAPVAEEVGKAIGQLGGTAMHLGGMAMQGKLAATFGHATSFLDQFGCVVLGVHALTQARVAAEALDGASEADKAFYQAKIAGAKFYASQVLPRSVAVGRGIRTGDDSCMDKSLFR